MKTIEEKRKCIEDFRKSGMHAKEYAEMKGIPVTTLKYWVRTFKDTKNKKADKFGKLEVTRIDDKPSEKTTKGQEIQFVCENIRIELKEGYDKEFFKRIVEVIVQC